MTEHHLLDLSELPLAATLNYVGHLLEMPRVPGETDDEYKGRIVASGKVSDVTPGTVHCVGTISMVSVELEWGFCEARGERP